MPRRPIAGKPKPAQSYLIASSTGLAVSPSAVRTMFTLPRPVKERGTGPKLT
jgi:hypothetical protein